MKHLTKFENQTLFDEAKDNLDKPHVSLTVDNDTVHYLKQQASPVVRPLPVVRSYDSLREFILSRPEDSQGVHTAFCVLRTFGVETDEGNVKPLVIITIREFTISMYIQYCDVTERDGHLMNATDVTTSIKCDEIPCATGTAAFEDVIDYLREVVDGMAVDGYEVDEISVEERGYAADARVDVLVDI